jgi:hypothetical protein
VVIAALPKPECTPGCGQAGRSPRMLAVMNICSPPGPNGE